METTLQLIQVVVQGSTTFVLCFVVGCAYGREYVDTTEGAAGQPNLGPMYKRGLLPSFLLAALFLGWLLEEGGAVIEWASGLLGLVAGLVAGLALREHDAWLRRGLVVGMVLVAADCFLEASGRGYLGGLLGALVLGGAIGVVAGAVALFLSVATRGLSERTRIWFLRAPFLASLLLVCGGPPLWLVVVAGLVYGFRGTPRYHLSLQIPAAAAFAAAIGVLAFAHATYSFYFSFMSNYGIFSHPVVSVSPYALASVAVGVSLQGLSHDTWPIRRRWIGR
jgi:MFS family permease